MKMSLFRNTRLFSWSKIDFWFVLRQKLMFWEWRIYLIKFVNLRIYALSILPCMRYNIYCFRVDWGIFNYTGFMFFKFASVFFSSPLEVNFFEEAIKNPLQYFLLIIVNLFEHEITKRLIISKSVSFFIKPK